MKLKKKLCQIIFPCQKSTISKFCIDKSKINFFCFLNNWSSSRSEWNPILTLNNFPFPITRHLRHSAINNSSSSQWDNKCTGVYATRKAITSYHGTFSYEKGNTNAERLDQFRPQFSKHCSSARISKNYNYRRIVL